MEEEPQLRDEPDLCAFTLRLEKNLSSKTQVFDEQKSRKRMLNAELSSNNFPAHSPVAIPKTSPPALQ